MICTACKQAGDLWQDLNKYTQTDGYESILSTIVSYHNQCEGKTRCDCQHQTEIHLLGKYVEVISAEETDSQTTENPG